MYCLKNAEQGYLDIFEGSKSIFFKFCAWFLKAYSMEPVHDIIFFLSSLTSRLQRKYSSNVVIDSHVIFKKCRTRVLRHSLKGPNPIFFIYFVLDFWGPIRWNRFTILLFLSSLTSRLQRKHPSNVVIDTHIIFKKCRTEVLRHSLKGPNPIFFFYFVPIFLGPIRWNRFTILFFLVLWCPGNRKSAPRISTPT